ncbi:MAG TPA: hypothetical protein VGK73_15700, partial [Polyangiaceae bacterium]
MFGFLFGSICLIGLFVVISRSRRWHGFGRHRHGYRHGFGPRAALHGLLERLDTGPGQEKV